MSDIERLRNGAVDGHETVPLSESGDCPAPDNAARQDILTDKERWAIEASIAYLQPVENYDNRVQTVLRKLLERLA